jgi:hypothetical protein
MRLDRHLLPHYLTHECQCCRKTNRTIINGRLIVWTRDGNRRWWFCSKLCATIGKPPLPTELQIQRYLRS